MRSSLHLPAVNRLLTALPIALLAPGCGGGDTGQAFFTNRNPGTSISGPASADQSPVFGGAASQDAQNGATPQIAVVTIGADNAAQVAASVIGVLKAVLDVGDLGIAVAEASGAAALGVRAARSIPRAGLSGAASRAAARRAPRTARAVELIADVGIPTYSCDNGPGNGAAAAGGTFSLQDLNITNPNYYLSGRTLVVGFDDCAVGAVHADGGLNIKDLNVADDPETPATEILSGQFSFNGLTLLGGAAGLTLSNASDSAMRYRLSEQGGVIETEISTGFMTVARDGSAGDNLHDLAIHATYDYANQARSWSVAGEITSIVTDGALVVTTPQPLTWLSGSGNPTGGVIAISGTNNTCVRLTAYGNDTVRMETDSDGNGSTDEEREIMWQALLDGGA